MKYMREIKITRIGAGTINMLVQYFLNGEMLDFEILNDTKEIQKRLSEFLFSSDFKIKHF